MLLVIPPRVTRTQILKETPATASLPSPLSLSRFMAGLVGCQQWNRNCDIEQVCT